MVPPYRISKFGKREVEREVNSKLWIYLRYNAAFWIIAGDAVGSAMIFRSDPRQLSAEPLNDAF